MKRILTVLIMLTILASAGARALSVFEYEPVFFDYIDNEQIDLDFFEREYTPASSVTELSINAPSAILMERDSGKVIFEKDADTKREPASVTKVMTMLLIVEALESGTITMDEMVTTSAFAASMGGSQIYLEEGEQMNVREMLKAIVVSSANDAAVAMAEHISGSEQVFVSRMNVRAVELGMVNTHFTNSTGLMDDATHVTTPRDIAIMSRELIRHDMIKEFTTIWTDTLRNGEFGLSNTNKLIRFYEGATGLKTGFTQRAMHCLAATAERDGVEYIAVVLAADTSADRFESARTLLSFAFANFTTIAIQPDEVLPPVRVTLGQTPTVQPVVRGGGRLLVEKRDAAAITKQVELVENITAPVPRGSELGRLTIQSGETLLGEYTIIAGDDVERLGWGDIFVSFLRMFFTGR
ncbi:MAG: D-alanyl-D-alanine carboxypeptidase [Oscillospiraceae bacterium]|nr:D-alanyl-D-alanine carboxypeptidase [Oscillospiraceae bacterium]